MAYRIIRNEHNFMGKVVSTTNMLFIYDTIRVASDNFNNLRNAVVSIESAGRYVSKIEYNKIFAIHESHRQISRTIVSYQLIPITEAQFSYKI